MDSLSVKAYCHFAGVLVTAKPEYLSLILGKIAEGFTYRAFRFIACIAPNQLTNTPESGLQTLEACLPESSKSPLTRRVVYDRLHFILQHLLHVVPTLPSTLQPLLVRYFPHKRQSQATQITYIRNLLRVTRYCPELADRILSTIVERVIQIDVRAQ